MKIIVCGAGAIGAAVAYFCSKRGAQVLVVERNEPGGAASGKSGGFLALDWCRGSRLDALARRSFHLHAELAGELGNPWFYRRVRTLAGYADGRKQATLTAEIGTPETTAVIEPRLFTQGLLEAARRLGAELITGAVSGLAQDADGAVSGCRLQDGRIVQGDAVVIAMGPWSVLASRWLRLPSVHAVKGHSLVFQTGEHAQADAWFLEVADRGEMLAPEIFPRANGTVWACAISSTPSLPLDPAAVAADTGAHERLEAICRAVCPPLAKATVIARQACFRPLTDDGLPLVGAVRGAPGAFVATGHSVWGMLNAPATGEAMADLLLEGNARHVDLAPFAPERLRPAV